MHTSIYRILSNYYNPPSIGSQILHDEFYVSSVSNLYSRCRMNIASETAQPTGLKLVSHGLLTTDPLKTNSRLWILDTNAIINTPNNIHGSASEHVVGQRTSVGASVGDYRRENYKTDFEILHKNSKLQSERKSILTTFEFDSCWYKNVRRKNTSNGLFST